MYIVAPRQVHQPSELNPADTAPTPPRSRSIGMHVPPVLWLCVGQESSPLRETPPQEHGGRQRSPKRVPQRGVRRSRCRCRHNCDHHRDVESLSILLYLIRRDTRRYTCLKQFATPLLVKPGYRSRRCNHLCSMIGAVDRGGTAPRSRLSLVVVEPPRPIMEGAGVEGQGFYLAVEANLLFSSPGNKHRQGCVCVCVCRSLR